MLLAQISEISDIPIEDICIAKVICVNYSNFCIR